MITALTWRSDLSRSKRFDTLSMPLNMSMFRALCFSGRFRVTQAMWSFTSSVTHSAGAEAVAVDVVVEVVPALEHNIVLELEVDK